MESFILALDQGTTSCRAILFDRQARAVATAQQEFKQYFPEPGWVEHDALEIWQVQQTVANEVIRKAKLRAEQIAGVGITNQRETTVIWERKTGQPIHRAIVWQDRRTAEFCKELNHAGRDRLVKEKTGLVIDAYFSASKVKWLLDHVPGARERALSGELAFGTMETWLMWNLTEGRAHLTDVSNASRTLLMNIHTLKWDDALLELFDIPASLLPNICGNSEPYGHTSLFGGEIPLCGMAGDQQAALFGQLCLTEGMVKNTYGTGCFMLMNTGTRPVRSSHRLLTTVAWRIGQEVSYALEGSVFMGGAIVQWLRDGLGIIARSSEVEALARSVPDNGGVYFVPAFTGLGAPHWDAFARGLLIGMTRGTNSGHIARAALEAICFQSKELLEAMVQDAKMPLSELRVDGGATANDFLMQLQADVLQTNVFRPPTLETTALGAAYLAGLAVGFWKDVDALRDLQTDGTLFSFGQDKSEDYRQWGRAVQRAKNWIE